MFLPKKILNSKFINTERNVKILNLLIKDFIGKIITKKMKQMVINKWRNI